MAGFALTEDLYLASQSRARAALLAGAGLDLPQAPAAVDESELKAAMAAEGHGAGEVAKALATLKAQRVSERVGPALVLGADQMLAVDNTWLTKPHNFAEARETLQRLQGRSHQLVTAAALVKEGARIWHAVDRAELVMHPLSDAFLDAYLAAAGEAVLASVGAYQLEGLGAHLFHRVRGDYFTVLGLPLLPLLTFLHQRGSLTP